MFSQREYDALMEAVSKTEHSVTIDGITSPIEYGFDSENEFYAQVSVALPGELNAVILPPSCDEEVGKLTHVRVYPDLDNSGINLDNLPVLSDAI